MKKTTALLTLLAALVAVPAAVRAQDASTNAPSAAPAKKHGDALKGKVTAVDASSITVKDQTAAITADTKVLKGKEAASVSDIKVGEMVSVAYKKDDAGKLTATVIHIGAAKKKKTE